MGTRSNTIVIDDGKPLVNMYRQFDGYPAGHGAELAGFLSGILVVNGLGLRGRRVVANGGGCLAAQMVAHFKTEPGGIYLAELEQQDNDYTYRVSVNTYEPDKGISIEVLEGGDQVFSGSVGQFVEFCEQVEA